jgi:hypothetical protein
VEAVAFTHRRPRHRDWYHLKGRESTVEVLQAYLNKSVGSYDKDVGPNFKEPGE